MSEIIVLIAAIAVVWLVFKRVFRGQRKRLKCADCRHLIRSFDDGVRCGYGGGDVFKTPVHIANCMDHEPR